MHPVENTDAVILTRRNDREADALFMLYTHTHGLIVARAQGACKESSKLRYTLRELSVVHVSLVRTRAHWRIVGALPVCAVRERAALACAARVAHLVIRLVQHDEADTTLFTLLRAGFCALEHAPNTSTPNVEALLVARVMHTLGYLREREAYRTLLLGTDYPEEALTEVAALHPQLISDINDAIATSGLV